MRYIVCVVGVCDVRAVVYMRCVVCDVGDCVNVFVLCACMCVHA